jgi:hypothetical protein
MNPAPTLHIAMPTPSRALTNDYNACKLMWIDEIAHSALPRTEAGDIVFETSAEAIEALSTLFGKPLIRDLPVTEADARAFIALVKSGSPEDVLRQFLARYRAAKGHT